MQVELDDAVAEYRRQTELEIAKQKSQSLS